MDILGYAKLLFDLFTKYGTLGLAVGQIILILFLFKKLFTNHLHHMTEEVRANHKVVTEQITGIKTDLATVRKEVAEDRKATQRCSLKIANIEGQLLERRASRNVKAKKVISKTRTKKV